MQDDDELDEAADRHREIAERYGWQPGEREQIAEEMRARQERIDRDAALARCFAQAESAPPVVTRSMPPVVTRSTPAPAAVSTAWIKASIRREVRASERAMAKAIAQTILPLE